MFDYMKYRKEYYINNKERFQQYYEENKDYISDRNKAYYQNNRVELRDKQSKYFKNYYLLNREKIKESSMNRYYQYCNENNILAKKRKPIQCNEILNQNIIISISD
jgi:hypothetical protein